jgi:hypothetical protein
MTPSRHAARSLRRGSGFLIDQPLGWHAHHAERSRAVARTVPVGTAAPYKFELRRERI